MSVLTVPEWVYVFVNPQSPMAVMNLRITGRYVSSALADVEIDPQFAAAYRDGTADFLPFVPNPSVSTSVISPFVAGVISDYRVEIDAELFRRRHFPQAPSRLTGVFALDDYATCQTVSATHNWNLGQVQRFKPQNVLRAARVNMDIVSLARTAYLRSAVDVALVEHLWTAYWSGADHCEVDLPSVDAMTRQICRVGVTWEWLIDGVLLHESRVVASDAADGT
jgi:hypothetical protein